MDFFNDNGILTLICLAIFPRLTLLFASFASGGMLWWLGWVFAPHLLVAILAIPYWDSNPALVIFAWLIALIALTGKSSRTKIARK
tara:strand:+ start:394 stop:651 length:258 start_codon:yes stop_codon:yes gene_type:complete